MAHEYSERLFKVVDSLDADGFAEFFTDDAVLTFANADPLDGKEAIRDGLAAFFDTLQALRHDPNHEWFVDDTHVVEATVTYTLPDERVVAVPAVSIFHRRADLVDSYRIYVDLAPLAA